MFVLGCFVCFCAIFLWSRDLCSVSSQLFPFLSSSLFCSVPRRSTEIIGSAPITGNNFPFFNRKIHQRGKQAFTHQQKRAKEFSNGEPLSCSGQPYLQYWQLLTTFDEVPMNINESVAISKNFQPSFGRPGQTQRTQKIQSDIRNWFQQCSTSDLGGQGTKTKTHLIAFGFHPWR